MSISEETAKKLVEAINRLSEQPKPEQPKPRTYKCTGSNCGFTTTDPDEYIHHRMGEVYGEQQATKQKIDFLETELNTLKNPPKPKHEEKDHEWEGYGLFRKRCTKCGETRSRNE